MESVLKRRPQTIAPLTNASTL